MHPVDGRKLCTDPVDLIVVGNEQIVLHVLAIFAQYCYYLSKVLGVTPVRRLKWRLRWLWWVNPQA
jgi:hypothetical protein